MSDSAKSCVLSAKLERNIPNRRRNENKNKMKREKGKNPILNKLFTLIKTFTYNN